MVFLRLLDSVTLQWCQDPDVLLAGLAAVSDGRCWRIWLQWSNGAALGLSGAAISPSRGARPVPLRLRLEILCAEPQRAVAVGLPKGRADS